MILSDDNKYKDNDMSEEQTPEEEHRSSSSATDKNNDGQDDNMLEQPNDKTYPYGSNNGIYNGSSHQQQYENNQPSNRGYYNRPWHNYQDYPSDYNNGNKNSPGKKIFVALISVALIVALVFSISVIIDNNDVPIDIINENGENSKLQGAENAPSFALQNTPAPENTTTITGEMSSVEIYKNIRESAVGILVYNNSSKSLYTEGSGVIMGEDSSKEYTYIITCAHVIRDENTSISVQLYDGSDYKAEIVGYDTRTDIGVIRIKTTGLKAANFGDSVALEVGQKIYAIGNPGGTDFAGSFTSGMVSAIDRPVNSSQTGYTMLCIQHDAAINPGNSGGALLNSYGQVIGINSMKIVSANYEGMGFAVPSTLVKEIYDQLIANGYVPNRPKLGISYSPASSYQTYSMVVQIKGLPSGSIIIREINSDSSLVDTNVKIGDMIVAVNGAPLTSSDVLATAIEESKIGDKIKLSIVRVNEDYSLDEFDVNATLVEDKGDNTPTENSTEPETDFFFPFG